MSDPEFQFLASIWRILGKRWTIAILQNLSAMQTRRFTEQTYNSMPPKVEYRLTPIATELVHIMEDICRWHARRDPGKAHQLGMNPIAL